MDTREHDVESYLVVGGAVQMELQRMAAQERRLATQVRGWQKQAYIILDRPKLGERFAPIQEGDPCVIRFLHEGEACAFDSLVLSCDSWIGSSRCHISWPVKVEIVRFRRFERVKVCFACRVKLPNNEAYDAEIRDISLGGLAIQSTIDVASGVEMLVDFAMPDGVVLVGTKTVVRNSRPVDQKGFLLGCEFTEGQEHLLSDIAFFVTTSLHRAQPASSGRRILIIDDDPATSAALWRGFRALDCEAFIAADAADGLSRLRVLNPSAVVINESRHDLPGHEVVRLIRSASVFRSVPVFIHGASSSSLSESAGHADAVVYFEATSKISDVCDTVVQATG